MFHLSSSSTLAPAWQPVRRGSPEISSGLCPLGRVGVFLLGIGLRLSGPRRVIYRVCCRKEMFGCRDPAPCLLEYSTTRRMSNQWLKSLFRSARLSAPFGLWRDNGILVLFLSSRSATRNMQATQYEEFPIPGTSSSDGWGV